MESKLTALYELGQRLVLLRDAEQIAEAVLDIAARVLDCQDSNFFLVDDACQKLCVIARRGQLEDDDGLRLPLDGERGITVAAARTGEPVYVPDVRRDPRYVDSGLGARSELVVPVQIEGRVLGVLNVESTRLDAFSQADRVLLSILADEAALALENARLWAEERRRAEEMTILSELTRQIGASLELETTLQTIVSTAAELIPCVLAEISLWDERTEMLTLHAIQCELDRAFPIGQSFPPGEGYTGWIVRHRTPLLVPDVDARDDVQPHLLPGEHPFKAYAGIPLLVDDRLIGALVLIHERAGAFGEHDLNLLKSLGGQAAAAIRNARLYEEVAHRHEELAALFAVGEAVNRPGELHEILEEGLKQSLAVTGLEMGALALRDQQSDRLELYCQAGMSAGFVTWLSEHLKEKSDEVWPGGRDLDVEAIPLDNTSVPAQLRQEGIRLTADVPLFAEGKFVGILSVATRTAHSFTADERSLLQAIGHQLGTAIANARLRQEALAAERLAAVGRVAASVAHDLRSPLGGILRSAEFLARPELSPDTRQKLSRAVASLAHRLMNTSQEILDFARGESLPLRPTPCLLSEFLNEVLAVLEIDFSDRGIEVGHDFGYQGSVVMDADRMAQVVYNIATNARDAMPQGGTFSVTTRQIGERVELRFTDTGPGIPEAFRDRIFDPFFTYGKREGVGLGLAIARRIVEDHGGELRVESGDEQGATFVVVLPV